MAAPAAAVLPSPSAPPPTGGGSSSKLPLVLGTAGAVAALVVLLIAILVWPVGLLTGDDDDPSAQGEGESRNLVTQTVTSETSEATTPPTTVDTTTAVVLPPDDPTITAQAYVDSLVTGNCLAVEGLSTPEWFVSEYGSQRGCKRESPNSDRSQASYDFEEPVDNGDGTVNLVATITAPDVSVTATWILVPDPDATTWLVDFFTLD